MRREWKQKWRGFYVKKDVSTVVTAYFADKMAGDRAEFQPHNVQPSTLMGIMNSRSDDYLLISFRATGANAKKRIESSVNIPFGAGIQEELNAFQFHQDKVRWERKNRNLTRCGAGWLGAGYLLVR